MVLLIVITGWLLRARLKTNSPLRSVIFLILSLVTVTPILSRVSHVWYVYLTLILFLGGIFVLVLYFSRLCTYLYKEVSVSIFFIYSLLFRPWSVYFINRHGGISVMFNYSVILVVIIIILMLTSLILFSSYILSRRSALRNI